MDKNWEIIAKYLSGEASSEEKEEVLKWVNDSEANRRLFEDAERLWNQSDQLDDYTEVSTQEEWDKLQRLVKNEQNTGKVVSFKRNAYLVAASLSLLVVAAVSFFIWKSAQTTLTGMALYGERGSIEKKRIIDIVSIATTDSLQNIMLGDSTEILLNKNSKLVYNTYYGRSNRTLRMEGEAFFRVTRDTVLPFIVHAGAAEIKVLGTSFNVKEDGDEVVVDVEEGTVVLSSEEAPERQQVLKKDEKGTFNKKSHKLFRTKSDLKLRWWLKEQVKVVDRLLKDKEVDQLFKKLKIK